MPLESKIFRQSVKKVLISDGVGSEPVHNVLIYNFASSNQFIIKHKLKIRKCKSTKNLNFAS